MRVAVHVENPRLIEQALRSRCDTVRFGADLCDLKLLSATRVREICALVEEGGKQFAYVCPRLPINRFGLVEEHIRALDGFVSRPTQVITNDWGIVNQLTEGHYAKLVPHMGRQLVSIPRRGRPSMVDLMSSESDLKRFVMGTVAGVVFDKTNLNFKPTVKFLTGKGVEGADIDWVPECFAHLGTIVKQGLGISVHLRLIIVSISRRCHTARHFDEPIPNECSMPCLHTSFLLKHDVFGDLYMDGNTLFSLAEPTRDSMHRLRASGVSELVLTMGPMTGIQTTKDIDAVIAQIESWA